MKRCVNALALFLSLFAAMPAWAQSGLTERQKRAHEEAKAAANATLQSGGLLDGMVGEKGKARMPAAALNEAGVPGAGSTGSREANLITCTDLAKSGTLQPAELSAKCESVVGSAGVSEGSAVFDSEMTAALCTDVVNNRRAPGTTLGRYCEALMIAKKASLKSLGQRAEVRGGLSMQPLTLTDKTKPPVAMTKDDIANSYSACTSGSEELPRAKEEEVCSIERVATRDNKCTKTLEPQVTWVCPAGAISGPRRVLAAQLGGHNSPPTPGRYVCTVRVSTERFSCPTGFTGPTDLPVPPGTQPVPACTSTANGSVQAAIRSVETRDEEQAATYDVVDRWTGDCESLEQNTPPAYRRTLGGTQLPMAEFDSRPNTRRCGLSSGMCTDVRTVPTIINDVPISRSCWATSETFDCMTTATTDTCEARSECEVLPEKTCTSFDNDSTPPSCLATEYKRSCAVGPVIKRDTTSCETQTFCPAGGACWDTGYKSASGDFSKAITLFTGAQQGGRYYNANDQELFKGYGGSCREIHSGGIPINCCKKSVLGNLLYNALHLADNYKPGGDDTKDENGKSMFNDKTYDFLFAADNSGGLAASLRGLDSMAGEAKDTWNAIRDGDIGKAALKVFITSPKAIAEDIGGAFFDAFTTLITLFGILDGCNPDDNIMVEKRSKNLCVEVGTHVTERVPLFGWWWTREHRHCCFNSLLAKLINDQGRAQIITNGKAGDAINAKMFPGGAATTVGGRFGGANSLNCGGFSPDQLKQIDFGKLDLTPFLATINPKMGSADDAVAKAKQMLEGCAGGADQCGDKNVPGSNDPKRMAVSERGKDKPLLSLRPLMIKAFPLELGRASAVTGVINNEDIRLLSKYRFRKDDVPVKATVWPAAEHSTLQGCRIMGVEIDQDPGISAWKDKYVKDSQTGQWREATAWDTKAVHLRIWDKRPPITTSITFCQDGSAPGALKINLKPVKPGDLKPGDLQPVDLQPGALQ